MKERTTKNYIDVLEKVADVLKLQPKVAVSDFEKAAQKALRIVFPGIKLVGCFFHYSQALLNNAKKHHILQRRNPNDDPVEWGFVKLLTALALLPANLIEEGFHLITQIIFNIEENEKLQTFASYYKQTWLQGFKPDLFSVYGRSDKTNNIFERHNRELKETLKEHSTILTFLRNLTGHHRKVRSFLSNKKFWTRTEKFKKTEIELRNIWNTIEEEGENVDLLLIMYKLSKIIGKN